MVVYHIHPTDMFWGASWTGHDLSQITGHKLFLPVPMGARGPIPGWLGTHCASSSLLGSPERSLAFSFSKFKRKKKQKGGKQPDFLLLPLLNRVLARAAAFLARGSISAGSMEG